MSYNEKTVNQEENSRNTVIRIVHNRENPFVQLNKQALWDPNLSLRAVGLWARCLSRPNDWTFSIKELSSKCKEGRQAIDSAMQELIKANYVVRLEYYEKGPDGRFQKNKGGLEYVFFEFPATEEEKLEQLEIFKKSFRHSGFRDCGFRDRGNPQLLRKKNNKEKEKEQTTTTTENQKPEKPKPEKPKPQEPKKSKDCDGGGASHISFNRQTKKFDGLTAEYIKLLQETFPGLDIQQHLNEMQLWLLANTHRHGTQAFITKWLKKNMQEKPKSYVAEEEPEWDVDPELKQQMRERDERIQRELRSKQETQDEG